MSVASQITSHTAHDSTVEEGSNRTCCLCGQKSVSAQWMPSLQLCSPRVPQTSYRGGGLLIRVRRSCWKMRASTLSRSEMQWGWISNRLALLPRDTRVMEKLFWESLQCWKLPVPESMGTDTEVLLFTQNSWSPGSFEKPFIIPGSGRDGRKAQ